MGRLQGDWKRIGKIAVVIAFLVVFVGVLITTVPQVAGADHSYVVLSDSMSPSIQAGSVVLVSEVPTDTIESSDVITFQERKNDGTKTRVTHRVVDVISDGETQQFRTQGDANSNPDPQLVSANSVIGVVQFHLPLIGYLFDFADSPIGIAALIIVPAVLLVGFEARDLYRAVTESGAESSEESDDGGAD
ncbi:signal peptidase I [Halorhabdus salina]|uniref:signal peptidase I n=1 Tax=Halorhabdus salina TaxID=2750670 RepID=UPI0015EE87C8|nr:signal peptidase I [Halorhabdus salina]